MGWLGEGLAKRSHTAPMSVGLLLLSSSRSPPQPSIPSTTSSPNPPRPPTPLTPRRTLAPPTEEWSLGPPVHEAELGLPAIAPATYTLFQTLLTPAVPFSSSARAMCVGPIRHSR